MAMRCVSPTVWLGEPRQKGPAGLSPHPHSRVSRLPSIHRHSVCAEKVCTGILHMCITNDPRSKGTESLHHMPSGYVQRNAISGDAPFGNTTVQAPPRWHNPLWHESSPRSLSLTE